MTKPKTSTPAANPSASETEEQRFERILLRPEFKPLKGVFDNLGIVVPLIWEPLSPQTPTRCF